MTLTVIILTAATVIGLFVYMLLQKAPTRAQGFLEDHRYQDALTESLRLIQRNPADTSAQLHRAEAAKLLGKFDEALTAYLELMRLDPKDAAAREGVALTLTYLGRDPGQARRLMEEALANYPAIQEFQALALAFILARQGKREEALRLYEDNLVLLETRFRDDYTDPDPLLAEVLFHFAELSRLAGDGNRSRRLQDQAKAWAPGSVFAKPSGELRG